MKYNIVLHENFKKEAKPLLKKFLSLKNDLKILQENIENQLQLADNLGNGFKKNRIRITSKGKGSGGDGRIIVFETFINVEEKQLLFCSIYNKTDFENIDIAILKENLDL